jgi:hypothetical protein
LAASRRFTRLANGTASRSLTITAATESRYQPSLKRRVDRPTADRCREFTAAPFRPPAITVREFCTCFNDADAVIVAKVYPAGEARSKASTATISCSVRARTAIAR